MCIGASTRVPDVHRWVKIRYGADPRAVHDRERDVDRLHPRAVTLFGDMNFGGIFFVWWAKQSNNGWQTDHSDELSHSDKLSTSNSRSQLAWFYLFSAKFQIFGLTSNELLQISDLLRQKTQSWVFRKRLKRVFDVRKDSQFIEPGAETNENPTSSQALACFRCKLIVD